MSERSQPPLLLSDQAFCHDSTSFKVGWVVVIKLSWSLELPIKLRCSSASVSERTREPPIQAAILTSTEKKTRACNTSDIVAWCSRLYVGGFLLEDKVRQHPIQHAADAVPTQHRIDHLATRPKSTVDGRHGIPLNSKWTNNDRYIRTACVSFFHKSQGCVELLLKKFHLRSRGQGHTDASGGKPVGVIDR